MANGARSSFRASGRRAFRRKQQFGWTAADPTAVAVGNATASVVIMAGSDWARGGGTSQSATLMGIRGGFAYQPGGVSGIVRVGIFMYDEGETIDTVNSITTLIEEDVLWTWAYSHPVTPVMPPVWVDINVRSKRKVTLDSVAYLVYTGSAASMGTITPMLRAVLKFS